MPLRPFLLSLPERAVRSLSALAGGLAREVGDLALPARVRRTRLYQTMVDSTLRFLIEQVGQVEGAYPVESGLPADFLVRRTAGNALEVAGIAAFHASPVWVLAALADLSGAGRELIVEIAGELKQDGLLEPDRTFDSADQLLDGIERAAGRLAESINTPPLDAAALKAEWARLREEVRAVPLAGLPSPAALGEAWRELLREAAAQAARSRSFPPPWPLPPCAGCRRTPAASRARRW